jgi:hypothetical protein
VLSLPAGEPFNDIASVYRAVTGGYRAINGYSGYEPPYYEALRTLSDAGDDRVFTPLAARGDLHVLVSPDDALWRSRVERQPGARRVSEGTLVHYLIPHREVPASGFRDATRLAIAAATASCSTQQASLAVDGRLGTKWGCGGLESDQSITVVLRMPADVGRVVIPMGTSGAEFGRNTVVDTSLDGETWTPAWEGSPAAGLLQSALAAPYDPAVFIEFSPRAARYVRLRQTVRDERYFWSIPEIEIFGGESRR